MEIKQLTLKNYRNYQPETIEFFDGINLLIGLNAQGKTNIVESIFYLCTGFSPRAKKDAQLINDKADTAYIKGVANTIYGKTSVEIFFNKTDKKSIKIDGITILKLGELMENMRAVYFSPQELKLVQEAPEDRRRFLNVSLCQMNKGYFYALKRYNNIIEQRNALLKNPDRSYVLNTLSFWDEQLAKEAAKIIYDRNNFIESLIPFAKEIHKTLSLGKEELNISSEQGFVGEIDDIKNNVYLALRSAVEKDIRLGYTTIGPHRDDLKITLNGKDVRFYGSQGQQRTTALSIKLAETEIFNKEFKEYPILILDDVFSELDKSRRECLIKMVQNKQTIITATKVPPNLFKGITYKKLVIDGGKVKSQKIMNLR